MFELNWDQTVKKHELKGEEKVIADLQQHLDTTKLIHKKKNLIHEQVRNKAMMNIYRKKYNIPEDLMVRRADTDIRMAMESSETIDKIRRMAENSIHPSMIFFEKELNDIYI